MRSPLYHWDTASPGRGGEGGNAFLNSPSDAFLENPDFCSEVYGRAS